MRRLKAAREYLVNCYYVFLRWLIPCKLITIETVCPLWSDKCDKKIQVMILTNKAVFSWDELLDYIWEDLALHLKAKHDIEGEQFMGLQFKTPKAKYTVYLGAPEHK
jgi:hypothetical protein